MHPSLIRLPDKCPQLGRDVYLAAGARLVGEVRLGDRASVWFNTVLRGDIARVEIGQATNLQDNCVCHVGTNQPCLVGDYVTVGHGAILHGCRIGHEVLVGMQAVIMSGVEIGDQCIIGAAALLTEGMRVPAGSLVYGAPARVVSQLGAQERAALRGYAEGYCRWAEQYRAQAQELGPQR